MPLLSLNILVALVLDIIALYAVIVTQAKTLKAIIDIRCLCVGKGEYEKFLAKTKREDC